MINSEGQRFWNELDSPGREIAVANQSGKMAYLLLDQRLAERYSTWPHFISTAPEIAYAYVNDYLRLRPDVAVEGPTLAKVAALRGLPPAAVQSMVGQYNGFAAGRQSDPLGRCQPGEPLGGNRWVLLGPVKAYFTTTEGGPAVNQQLQVLDPDSRPIPGLYAVGRTAWVAWSCGVTGCTSPGRSPAAAWPVPCWPDRRARVGAVRPTWCRSASIGT